MVDNKWPYASDTNAVEYPVLTGLVMYVTSFVAHTPISYFIQLLDLGEGDVA